MPSRLFKPYLLAEVGGHLLAVDRKQPIAMLLGPDGRITSVASWSQVPPPPQPFDEDRRRVIYVQDDRVCVSDESSGPAVVLRASGGTLTLEGDDVDLAEWADPHYPRLFQKIHRADEQGAKWIFSGRHEGPKITMFVNRTRPGGDVREWDLGTGSASDALLLGGVPYVCVRRADKRPWHFDPPRDLWRIVDDRPERLGVDVDIADRCWPRRPYRREDLSQALASMSSDAEMATEFGATDVRIATEDLDGLPRLRLFFTLPDGRACVRTDQPFDELGGTTRGLHAMTIILDEDLHTGLVSAHASVNGLTPV